MKDPESAESKEKNLIIITFNTCRIAIVHNNEDIVIETTYYTTQCLYHKQYTDK